MVSSDGRLEDRLEALELEFNLLKTEIRQTLVDVKEFVMKGRSVTAQPMPEVDNRLNETSTGTQDIPEGFSADADPGDFDAEVGPYSDTSQESVASPGSAVAPQETQAKNALAPTNFNDSTMMKNIIWWLGTARRRGITLGQLSPFIEAYEMSGYMSPLVSKLIYKTMAQLADEESTTATHHMPQDFSDGLMQLNEIITTPNFDIQQKSIASDQLGLGEEWTQSSDETTDWGVIP